MTHKDEENTWHLQEGDVYEGYRVVRRIGSGGFGQVYLVRDAMSRVWALKIFLPAQAKDRTSSERIRKAAQRFLLEAAILESIKHTHIVRCERHGQAEDGSLWLLLEYLPGNTFRRELEISAMGSMPMERVLRFGLQLAMALLVVHGHGVVHRDIKPDNLMVLPGDILKLLDFGVAKHKHAAASFRTTRGVHYGTGLYMAPDRLMSFADEPSPLWDIYSAGLCLWEARAGKHPFFMKAGEELTDAAVIHKHLDGRSIPSLAEVTGDDEDVCEPILRACATDPGDRFQSAGDMLNALEDALALLRRRASERVSVLGTNVSGRTRARITSAITEPAISPPPANRNGPSGEGARGAAPVASPAPRPHISKTIPIDLPPEVAALVRPQGAAPGALPEPPPPEPVRFTAAGTERISAPLLELPALPSRGAPRSPADARDAEPSPTPRSPSPSTAPFPAAGKVPADEEAGEAAATAPPAPEIAPAPAPNVLRELGRPDLTPGERMLVAGLDPVEQRYRILFLRYLETLPRGVHIDMDLIGAAIAEYLEQRGPDAAAVAGSREERAEAQGRGRVPAVARRVPGWLLVGLGIAVGGAAVVGLGPAAVRFFARGSVDPAPGPVTVPVRAEPSSAPSAAEAPAPSDVPPPASAEPAPVPSAGALEPGKAAAAPEPPPVKAAAAPKPVAPKPAPAAPKPAPAAPKPAPSPAASVAPSGVKPLHTLPAEPGPFVGLPKPPKRLPSNPTPKAAPAPSAGEKK